MAMQIYTFGIFLLGICYASEMLSNNYNIYNGLKMSNPYKTISLEHDSILLCTSHCLAENDMCNSVNYYALTKTCELNFQSPQQESAEIVEDERWKIVYIPDESWELVFRGTAGNGIKMYPAYLGMSNLSVPEVGCHLTQNLTCTTHYRNSMVLDNWASQEITEIKLVLYQNGTNVVELIFMGMMGDSNTDWFHPFRLVFSSYSDLVPFQTYNYFDIQGDDLLERRFYINELYNKCADFGWMVVFDESVDYPMCAYENGIVVPHFAFMPDNVKGAWNDKDFQSADVLAIFVSREQGKIQLGG